MGYLRAATTLCCFTIASIITTTLCGCGGGGSLSSPATLEVRGQDFDGQRSVRFHNYNNWGIGTTSDPSDVLGQRLEILARRDNVTFGEPMEWPNDVLGWPGVSPRSLKALNPCIKVYRYYGLIAKNHNDSDWNNPQDTRRMWTPLTRAMIEANDWWMRDGNGQIVEEHEKTWLLDVGKPGFKEAFLKNALARNAGKGFDGFVLDYGWPEISGFLQGLPRPPAYPTDEDWFNKAWRPFIDYVTDGLRNAGYRVIGNCAGEYATSDFKKAWQRSKMDGIVYEQGAVGWAGEWLSGEIIERRINAISNDPLEVWVGDGGLLNSDPDYEQKQVVSLAMYYIAIPASQDKRSYHHKRDGEVYWQPLWDFYIGVPAEPAVKRSGKYFWSRKFTQGIVLLNYEAAESMTFSLNGTYRDPNGKIVSGDVILPPHTAMILAVEVPQSSS